MTVELHEPEVIAELNKNQEAFDRVQEEMEREHWGRTVLMHNGEVVSIYNDYGDAYSIACFMYGLGKFSLHVVGQQPVDLGFHTVSLISEE